MQTSVQKYSPRWLKDLLTFKREQVFQKIVQRIEKSSLQDILNLSFFCGFLILAFKFDDITKFFNISIRGNRQLALIGREFQYAEAIFSIMAVGTLSAYLKPASLTALQFLGFIVGVASLVIFGSANLQATEIWLYITANYGVFFIFYVWYRTSPRGLASKHYYFSLFILLVLLRAPDASRLELVWMIDSVRFLFVLSLLTLEHRAGISRFNNQESWAYFFSPAHLVTPLPIESVDWKYDASWNVRLRGLADVLTGYLFLILAYLLKKPFSVTDLDSASFYRQFGDGFMNYIYYFLGSFAWIAIPAGVARWYGVNLPAYFDAPLLATSPFERWKRWNIYYYNWLNKVIFFPIFKRTKSLALGVGAVFAITIFIHYGRILDGIMYSPRVYFQRFFFFVAHGVCVYISLRFRNLWPSENRRKGWWGVFVVTVLMSLIHLLGQ